MPLPPLTHLQFLVLSKLGMTSCRGSDLRMQLRAEGIRQSGPAFYQMMAVLEDAGFASGWYEPRAVNGQAVRERWYKVLAKGRRAVEATRHFYARHTGELPGLAFCD